MVKLKDNLRKELFKISIEDTFIQKFITKSRKIKYRILRGNKQLRTSLYKLKNRYGYPILSKRYTLGSVLEYILIVIFVLSIFNRDSIPVLKPILSNSKEPINRQIIFSQISVTFLTLSLISFLSNLKKDKVLGTSLYEIIFSKSVLGNIKLVSLVLFFLLFYNLITFFILPNSQMIILLFITCLALLSFLVIKVIFYTAGTKRGVNKIVTFYYMENLNVVKKPYKSHYKRYIYPYYLEKLREDTTEKIFKRDQSFEKNLNIYFQISLQTLVNFRKKVQENYTESIAKEDIIYYWLTHIKQLVKTNQLNSAINELNRMLAILIDNEVFLSNLDITMIHSEIIKRIANQKDKNLFEEASDNLFYSIKLILGYIYYRLNNDFSYTRLGSYEKSDLLYMHGINGEFLKDYYDLIDKELELKDEDKKKVMYKYLENIRMLSFEIDSSFSNNYLKVRHEYRRVLFEDGDDLNSDLEIMGFPLSLLLYQIIRDRNLDVFLYIISRYRSNSIYFACSIVVGKIIRQYLNENNKETKKYLKEIIEILMLKLEKSDYHKLKWIIFNLGKYSESIGEIPYYGVYYNKNDHELLTEAVAAIRIKKYNKNYETIILKNRNIKEFLNIYINLNKDEINQKIEDNPFNILDIITPLI